MNLKKFNFEDIPDQNGKLKHLIIGPISAGKTRVLNTIFNTNFPVGVGETTTETALVASSGNIEVYDSPGENQTFEFSNIDQIKFFRFMTESSFYSRSPSETLSM